MSKAEEDFEMMKKARKCLPDGGYSKRELNLAFYMFNKGYHQAEKDVAEAFARIVRGNLSMIDKSVQDKFEQLYIDITGEKMYKGFKD